MVWREGGAWVVVVAAVVATRGATAVRSMVRGGQMRDLSLGSHTIQGLQSMWQKESQEEQQRPVLLDPRKTWRTFIENAKRERDKSRRRKSRKRNRNNQIPMPREGPAGPQGRRGPPGEAGPPGGTLTTLEMEEYIKEFLKEYLSQNKTVNVSEASEEVGEEAGRAARSRVKAAFTAVLPQPATLKPAGLSVVDSFTITFAPGVFERRMVVERGGFTVVRRGIYQVAATLVLQPRPPQPPPGPQPHLSVYLCISNCSRDRRSLEWSGQVGEGPVTAVLVGHLLLHRGDTLLLAVNNPTKRPLQVSTGSRFSAALIGT